MLMLRQLRAYSYKQKQMQHTAQRDICTHLNVVGQGKGIPQAVLRTIQILAEGQSDPEHHLGKD